MAEARCTICHRALKLDTATVQNYDDLANRLCLFHRAKDDWYEAVTTPEGSETRNWDKSWQKVGRFWQRLREEIIVETDVVEDYDFSRFIFPPVTDANKNFGLYDKCFSKPVSFFNAQFHGMVCFSWVLFHRGANFSAVQFLDKTDFGSAQFFSEANFQHAIFFDEAYLGRVHFGITDSPVNANFQGAQFMGNANFYSAYFFGVADFVSTKFSVHASCANFNLAKFYSFTDFRVAQFSREAYFEEAEFSRKADFSSVYLKKASRLTIGGRAKELAIKPMINEGGTLRLVNLTVADKLTIGNINLEKAEFNRVRLRDCQIEITNSRLSACLFDGVDWGRTQGMEERFICDRDTFRQLKFANEQQGNVIAANMFYALEMREYEKELKKEQGISQDEVVFTINKAVSNFSQSWLRALGVYCAVVLVFLVMEGVSQLGFFPPPPLYQYWSWEKLLLFLNPLTDPRIIYEQGKIIFFWWSFCRLITAFIIYQFIMAVRNQTRRR
ncbi:MAG: hypothetical protein K9K75_00035 [Deltaproteobacteria bacterium]|nr:hypothetical protein [Deltaproteobacteria bacterium]